MREKISIKVNHRKSQIHNKLDKKLGFSLLLRDNDHQIVVVEKGRYPEKSAQDHTTLKEFKEEVRINLTQRTFVLFKYFKMNVFTKQIVDGNFQLKTSRVYFIHKNKKGSTYLMHSEQFIITKKLSAKPPNNKFV